jgi:hypothetical protein
MKANRLQVLTVLATMIFSWMKNHRMTLISDFVDTPDAMDDMAIMGP